jgi:hypothetical protein
VQELAQSGAQRLVEAMRASTGAQQLYVFANAISELSTNSTPQLVQAGLERLVAVMRTNTDAIQLINLAQAFQVLASHLSTTDVADVAQQIIDAMRASSDEEQIIQLGRILGAVIKGLSLEQSQFGIQRIIDVMQNISDNQQLIRCVQVLKLLHAQNNPALMDLALERITAAVRNSGDSEQISLLGMAIAELINTDGQQHPISASYVSNLRFSIERLIGELQSATNQTQLDQLRLALNAISKHLPTDQLQLVVQQVILALEHTQNWHSLIVLIEVLNALDTRIPSMQIEFGVERIAKIMMQSTYADGFVQLAATLESFEVLVHVEWLTYPINLLKSPLAVGQARKQILKFASRLAGIQFDTTETLIHWLRSNNPILYQQILISPTSPFQ